MPVINKQLWMIMVDKNTFKQKFLNQKGQAIFELILFLPILLFMYTIYYTAGNSISGSINQQKAVRGYFYTLVKGNSYLVTPQDLHDFSDNKGIKRVGFNAIGWNENMDASKRSFAPCFSFSSILKNSTTETCDGDEREAEDSSRFIRLFTFYGVCGPSYTATDTSFSIEPSLQGARGTDSCILSTSN